ncbi:MAG: hypothetical protein EBX37_10315 [Alphaproteobacteria bacterium]|nr:hypothetical protein [Alphaproteobacteria bacterium]
MTHRFILAALLVFALMSPLGSLARAQNAAPSVQVPLQDLPVIGSRTEQLLRWFSDLKDSVGLGRRALSIARSHGDNARTDDFNWLMGIAGFRMKNIESTLGLLPGLTLEFGQARELSEADREYLDRALRRHARRQPGPFSALQRIIISGILEANEIQGFNVEKLTVTLLPLPYVKFTIAPSDAPRGPEASRVLMAIERLNQRLQ